MRSILLAALACTCFAVEAAPPESKLPAAAQAVLERLAKTEARLESDRRKALSAERQKAIAELEKAQKAATRAEDLDGALAVRAKIEELQKADAAEIDSLLGDKPVAAKAADQAVALAKQVVGSWLMTKNGMTVPMELVDSGTVVAHLGQLAIPGRWRIDKGRLVIVWVGDEAKVESLVPDGPDRLVGDSYDAGKNGVVCQRSRPSAAAK